VTAHGQEEKEEEISRDFSCSKKNLPSPAKILAGDLVFKRDNFFKK